jgi:hypothetical protein
MSRARHRLTGKREATHNAPTSNNFNMVAYVEYDTFTRHVDGPINGGLTGGNGNTGSTSDSFLAALKIKEYDSPTTYLLSQVGAACHTVDAIPTSVRVPGTYYHEWPYFFNHADYEGKTELSPPTVDGWLGSFAKRYYAYSDLSKFATSSGLQIESGDQVNSAFLVLNLSAQGELGSEGYYLGQSAQPGGQYQHDERGVDVGGGGVGNFPDIDTNSARTYYAYKVLQPFSGVSMDNITWWGWTGGANDDVATTYWAEAGGGSYGVDITDLGVSAGGCVPDTEWQGCGYSYPKPKDDQNTPADEPEYAIDKPPIELRIDITHIVQDAIDNEGRVLRLAVYGENDTNLSAILHLAQVDTNPQAPYYHPWEFRYAKQTLVFSSASHPSQGARPRIEIDFTRR